MIDRICSWNFKSFRWPLANLSSGRTVKGSNYETKEAQAYLLWGQALLKLARTYFVPDANLGKDEYLKCLTLSMEKFNISAKILDSKYNSNTYLNCKQVLQIRSRRYGTKNDLFRHQNDSNTHWRVRARIGWPRILQLDESQIRSRWGSLWFQKPANFVCNWLIISPLLGDAQSLAE